MSEIDDLVAAEVAKRVNAGFGSVSEVWRSGRIAAFRERLARAERDRLWRAYIHALASDALLDMPGNGKEGV